MPAAQAVHVAEPGPEIWPTAHSTHSPKAAGAKVPALHSVQLALPATLVLPAAQPVHAPASTELRLPAAQSRQWLSPLPVHRPAAQGEHTGTPSAEARPAAHDVHAPGSVGLCDWPAGQWLQVLCVAIFATGSVVHSWQCEAKRRADGPAE